MKLVLMKKITLTLLRFFIDKVCGYYFRIGEYSYMLHICISFFNSFLVLIPLSASLLSAHKEHLYLLVLCHPNKYENHYPKEEIVLEDYQTFIVDSKIMVSCC